MKVYTNTTPLLAFAAIERFDILYAVHGKLHVVESVRKECQAGLPVIVPDLEQIQWIRLVASPSSADPRFLALDAANATPSPKPCATKWISCSWMNASAGISPNITDSGSSAHSAHF